MQLFPIEIGVEVEVGWWPTPRLIMLSQPPPNFPSSLKKTSGLAITSLVCGIISFVLPVLPAIVAIICGYLSRSRIKTSNGSLVGKRMALAGLICGYVSLVLITVIVCGAVYSFNGSKRVKAEEIAIEISRGKKIHALVLQYESDHGKFPERLGELVEKGYIDSLDQLQPTQGGHWVYFTGLTSKSSSYKYLIRSDIHLVCIYIDGTSGSRDLSFTLEPVDAPMRNHESVRE